MYVYVNRYMYACMCVCMYIYTFYIRLYDVRHMVTDHSDSEKENPLPPHELLFAISSKDSFICIIPQT